MATPPVEDPAPEPLKYQTWVLKVSIHCQGCSKKVKKVLQAIEGVYTTMVDAQQHKVTVTGNVDAETLIKMLGRYGKPAELWPQNPGKNDKKPTNSKTISEKQERPPKDGDQAVGDGDDQQKSAEKPADNPEKALQDGPGKGDKSPETGKKVGESQEGGGEAVTAAGGKKKKKKKGQKGNSNNGSENPGDAPVVTGSPPASTPAPAPVPVPAPAPAPEPSPPMPSMDPIPPRQPMYPYPPAYYMPSMYGVSYSTAPHPSVSDLYYAAPPMHANAYAQPLRYMPPPPSDRMIKFHDHHDDDLDDDDAGSACSIM